MNSDPISKTTKKRDAVQSASSARTVSEERKTAIEIIDERDTQEIVRLNQLRLKQCTVRWEVSENRSTWSHFSYAQFLQLPVAELRRYAQTDNILLPEAGSLILYDLAGYRNSNKERRRMSTKKLLKSLRNDGYEWKEKPVYTRKQQYALWVRHTPFNHKRDYFKRHEYSFDGQNWVLFDYRSNKPTVDRIALTPTDQQSDDDSGVPAAQSLVCYSPGHDLLDSVESTVEKRVRRSDAHELDLSRRTPVKQRRLSELGSIDSEVAPLTVDEVADTDSDYNEEVLTRASHVEQHDGPNAQHFLWCSKCQKVVTRKFAEHVKGHGQDANELEDKNYYKKLAIQRSKLLAVASVGSYKEVIESVLQRAGYHGQEHNRLRMELASSLEARGIILKNKPKLCQSGRTESDSTRYVEAITRKSKSQAERTLQKQGRLWRIVPEAHDLFDQYRRHQNAVGRREGGSAQYESYVLKVYGFLFHEWFMAYPHCDAPRELTAEFVVDHANEVLDYLELLAHLGVSHSQMVQTTKAVKDFFKFIEATHRESFGTLEGYQEFAEVVKKASQFPAAIPVVQRRSLKDVGYAEYFKLVFDYRTTKFVDDLQQKLEEPTFVPKQADYNTILATVVYTIIVKNLGARNEAFYKIRRGEMDMSKEGWVETKSSFAECKLLKTVLFEGPKSTNFSHHCLVFSKPMWSQLELYAAARDRLFPLSRKPEMHDSQQPFFVNSAGRRLLSSTVTQLMKSACTFKGAEFKATMNDVRHAAASEEVCQNIMKPDLPGATLAGHGLDTRRKIYADKLREIARTGFIAVHEKLEKLDGAPKKKQAIASEQQPKRSIGIIKSIAPRWIKRDYKVQPSTKDAVSKEASLLRRLSVNDSFEDDSASDLTSFHEVGPVDLSDSFAELDSLLSFKSCIEYDESEESFKEAEISKSAAPRKKPDLTKYLEPEDLASLAPALPYRKSFEVFPTLNWEIERDLLSGGANGYMENSGIMSLLSRILPGELVIGWDSVGEAIYGTLETLPSSRRFTFIVLYTKEPQQHWALAVHDMREPKVVSYYDSVYEEPTSSMNDYIEKVVAELRLGSSRIVLVDHANFRQQNGYDCGVYAMLVAQRLVAGQDVVIRPEDAERFRAEALKITRQEMFAEINQQMANHNAKACSAYPSEPLSDRDIWSRRTNRPVQSWDWLEVMPRRLGVGRGIRAKCNIPKGVIVCDYFGYAKDLPDYSRCMMELEATDKDLYNIIQSYALDRNHPNNKDRVDVLLAHNLKYDSVIGLGRLMNHTPHHGCENVTPKRRFLRLKGEKHSGPIIVFKTCRKIKAGEELLWGYGKNFNKFAWSKICPKCSPSPVDRNEEKGESYRVMEESSYKPSAKELTIRAIESVRVTDSSSIALYGLGSKIEKILPAEQLATLRTLDPVEELSKLCEEGVPTALICCYEKNKRRIVQFFFPGRGTNPKTAPFHIYNDGIGALVGNNEKYGRPKECCTIEIQQLDESPVREVNLAQLRREMSSGMDIDMITRILWNCSTDIIP
ncbi:hypothetical protein QR680_007296 [Steinernema hermaphroditum]|uniref:SET domain-containing protein n=1 Tax=Steinernema hermaphroditum TaxID=289476 RepID=A0AA39M555_9BILA|nr:hypothetical protein QR680_007296 [Steinernema hermaphroditum]